MKGKSKLIKSGPGTWGKLASKNGSYAGAPGVNYNTKNYTKKGKTASAPNLSNNMNPMKSPAGTFALKGV